MYFKKHMPLYKTSEHFNEASIFCLKSNGVNATQNAEAAGKRLVDQLSDDRPLEYTGWK